MKQTVLFRAIAFLLALVCLAGCGQAKKEPAAYVPPAPAETTQPAPAETTLPPQEQMPQKLLDQALAQIDMSLLCAGLDAELRQEKLEEPWRLVQAQVVYADYNQDGYRDVLLGRTNHLIFSLYPQREVGFSFAQSSPTYYTDDTGALYQCNGLGDGFDIEVDGKSAWVEHMNYWYHQWQGGDWKTAYSYNGTVTYVEGADGTLVETENTLVADIQGTQGTKQDLDQRFAEIGMRKITTRPAAYLQSVYDSIYQESLLGALDAYLAQNYSGYRQMLRRDLDGDGVEEAIFLVPEFENVWYDSLKTLDEYSAIEDARNWFSHAFSDSHDRTGVIIAQVKGGELTVTAHCALTHLSAYEEMELRTENGYLWIDGNRVYLNGRFAGFAAETLPEELAAYLADYGYADGYFCTVDVSDLENTEYLCVCRKDGSWYIFIIIIDSGDPVILYSQELSDSAVYLTEYDGQQCLLTYYQSVYSYNGGSETNYNYEVLRVTGPGETKILDSDYVSHTDQDQDATPVSDFFQKLNTYLIRIIVLRDPYKLTGRQWMDPAQAEHGTVPQEEPADPQQPEQNPSQEPVMGFVQIEDPASWLNLRVGPGVEYDMVLMDPADPGSFVRQALGSPVTVLETVDTDDPNHPVWLKIRITYADREIIGYSSKTYIRLVNE